MSNKKSITRVAGVSSVIRFVAGVIAVIAFAAMFLPQLKNPLADVTSKYYYLGILFGMTDKQGGGQAVTYTGAIWGFIGYAMILVGGLIGIYSAVKKAEGGAKVACLIVSAVLMITGGILCFCLATMFDYVNKAGFALAAGPIVAGVLAMVDAVVEIVAIFFR